MKGPGIKDYLAIIKEKKQQAIQLGKDCLEISSKQLHKEVSPHHATMPTCCQAIYKLMLEGDEILQKPRGSTGYGSHLHVRYQLENLEDRAPLYPSKKRGRPAKTEEEKLAAKKAKMKHNTEDLMKIIEQWLEAHGWLYEEEKGYLVAINDNQKWVINVQGIRRGRKQTLPVKMGEVLKHINDEHTRYSMAFNDSITYRRQWNEIPATVKERLNISVILADKKGNVIEI